MLFLCLVGSGFISATRCLAEDAISAGYGLGLWNRSDAGRIENGGYYDYAVISYLHERRITKHIALIFEPFVRVINRPVSGIDPGFNLSARGYLPELAPDNRLYLTVGAGAVYTSVKFDEQGTHGLFTLLGGIGYRRGRAFVETQFHHCSNGGLARPNRSVNSGLVRVGCYF